MILIEVSGNRCESWSTQLADLLASMCFYWEIHVHKALKWLWNVNLLFVSSFNKHSCRYFRFSCSFVCLIAYCNIALIGILLGEYFFSGEKKNRRSSYSSGSVEGLVYITLLACLSNSLCIVLNNFLGGFLPVNNLGTVSCFSFHNN